MVRKCVICGLTDSAKNNVSFHSFPTNEIYKKKWLDRCNMTQEKKQDKICSCHFNDSSFTTWIGRKSLKKDAIPELFLDKGNKYLKRIRKHSLSSSSVQSNLLFPLTSYVNNIIEVQDEVQDEIREQIKSGTQNLSSTTTSITTDISTCITPVLNESTSENEQAKNIVLPLRKSISVTNKISCPARLGDCTEEYFSTPRRAKKCFDLAVRKLFEHKKRLDASRKQITRLKSKILLMEALIQNLQDKQLISENAAQILLVHISRIFNTKNLIDK